MSKDTIAAQATAPGMGGIGIIRVSGPAVKDIAKSLLGCVPRPRYATALPFKNKEGITLDEGIALYFQAPNSFTGEDVLELQGHGGPVVLNSMLESVLQAGARQARPGEFSERAFLNEKIDLVQAEAIAGLIEASSEQAARSAMRSLQGEFSNKIKNIRNKIINLQILLEAQIDFPEEEIPITQNAEITRQLLDVCRHIQELKNQAKQGALQTEGLKVTIFGDPNVGKSSLMNYFSGEETSIVTDIAGTTRDIIRETILLDGIPIYFSDTAGIRETKNIIEAEGINRAKKEAKNADLILYVADATKKQNIKSILEDIYLLNKDNRFNIIIVRNKIDITQEFPGFFDFDGTSGFNISIQENKGLDELKKYIKKQSGFLAQEENTVFARKRHVSIIESVSEILINAKNNFEENKLIELLSEDLRQAQNKLSEILGEFTADDLLGKIFSEFCIGK